MSHGTDYQNYTAHVPGDGDVKAFEGSFEQVHHRVVEALNTRLGRSRWTLEYRGSNDIPHMQRISHTVTVSHADDGVFRAQSEPDLPLLRAASFPELKRAIDTNQADGHRPGHRRHQLPHGECRGLAAIADMTRGVVLV